MGLVFGPVALLGAYLVTYTLHGAASPAYSGLLHREASSRNRATILSMSSLAMQAGGAVAGPLLGLLAAHTSIATAMVVAGAVSILGVACFLPAWRRERARAGDRDAGRDGEQRGAVDDVPTPSTHG
ncbi:hypothetical protein BJM39_31730 [Salmonella enterica subsp. enterica serovar Javiana]|nr:hypothetical protein BJM39_31730 [Salmonella enterica subsp. enterica serovar Javiana]